ncbi:MAG: proline/glycine betaine ABC transporter permease [Desulfatibacillum sp.]|nr:proline/glycine betaine ABC transporter permease [Desulfatibacillum sp.]
MITIPKFPLDKGVEAVIDFLSDNFAFITKAVAKVVESGLESIVDGLMWLHPAVFILIAALIAWRIAKWRMALFTALGFAFIWNLQLWEPMLETLALVAVATSIAVAIGVPLGIFSAMYQGIYRTVFPILDFMQTMPAFVYLIPAIPFFGLGTVSAIFSTVIFAMPPAIRLTCLGIKQVPAPLIEASDSFGANRFQKLVKVQLPIATPTMMAGVNQTIMLSLSMVVIAAMIGAGGLGSEVWTGIQRLKPGMAFEGGLGVVILAIVLDRLTQKLGAKDKS